MTVKFRVTETVSGAFEDGEGNLPYDVASLGTPGVAARARVKGVSSAASAVIPAFNVLPLEIGGLAEVGQTLSLINDAWVGATAFDVEWYADGVLYATTSTLAIVIGLRGKTITARKRAQAVNGSDPSVWMDATNALFIPASAGDGTLDPNEYSYQEAEADADTRKTYVEIYDLPPSGYEWIIYRGPLAAGDINQVAVPSWDGAKFVWMSVGQASVGTGPNGRTTVYVRIGLREIANPANRYFVNPTGENFVASSIPGPPVVAFAQGAGQGEIDITITNASDTAGRDAIRYELQLDNGSWVPLSGGVALGKRTHNTGNPTTGYSARVRCVNVNGNGIATDPPASVQSGSVTVAPAAPDQASWNVTDKPSAGGNKVTFTFDGPLPADGGAAISDLGYRLNSGSFVSVGLTLPISIEVTVPATALATFDVVAVNSVNASNPFTLGNPSSKTVTPTTTTALVATAEFGSLTAAGHGGWKPTTALGDEVDILSIVSQAGMSLTWSLTSDADPVLNNALVCSGQPYVDHGKTLTIATAGGNITVTISAPVAVPAWSVRTPAQLGSALAYSNTSALTIYARPVDIDVATGTATVVISGTSYTSGRFYNRDYSGAPSARKVTKHPGQVKRCRLLKRSLVNNTKNLWLDEVDFFNATGQSAHLWLNAGACDGLKITNFSCSAPDPDPVALQDGAQWDNGPNFPLGGGFALRGSTNINARATNTHIENGVFKNCYSGGDYSTLGNFRLINLTLDTFYYDGFRLFPGSDTAPKLVKGIRGCRNFAIANELGTTGSQEPHPDLVQIIGSGWGEYYNFVHTEIEEFRGNYRGSVQSLHMGNARHDRGVMWNIIGNTGGIWTGIGMEIATDIVIGNSVFQRDQGSGASYVRLGGPSGDTTQKARGECLMFNVAAVSASGSALQVNQNSETGDFVTPTKTNCVDADSAADLVPYFNNVYLEPTSFEDLREKYKAKAGQTVGPLDESGNWRTTEYPPLPGSKPTLANSGADLIITPQVSMLYAVLPTTWDYKYRNANGVNNWTKVENLTGVNATLVAPNKTAIQVKCRWKSSAGIPGPWSETQTVIV